MGNKLQKPYLEDLEPKEGVLFIDTVYHEVAKETGFRVEDVREAWRVHKHYIKKLQEEKEEVIKLPYLGRLYFNPLVFLKYTYRLNLKSKKKLSEYIDWAKDVHERAKEINSKYRVSSPQAKKSNLFLVYKVILRKVLGIKKRVFNSFPMVLETISMQDKGELKVEHYDHKKKLLKKKESR